MAEQADDLTIEEKAAMELGKALYASILESALPQDIMEVLGKSIVTETPWVKLPPKQKVALFRVAGILQDKFPKVEIGNPLKGAAEPSEGTGNSVSEVK